MGYTVQFSDRAKKSLKQIDRYQSKIIVSWIDKNLVNCNNPRLHGKVLIGDRKEPNYVNNVVWLSKRAGYEIICKINTVSLIKLRDYTGEDEHDKNSCI